jgi:hypothetical protein
MGPGNNLFHTSIPPKSAPSGQMYAQSAPILSQSAQMMQQNGQGLSQSGQIVPQSGQMLSQSSQRAAPGVLLQNMNGHFVYQQGGQVPGHHMRTTR